MSVPTSSRLNLIYCRGHRISQGNIILGFHTSSHLVNLSLSVVDQISHFTLAGVAHICDTCSRIHEPAQHRFIRNDGRVVPSTGRRGHTRDDGVQVIHSTSTREHAGLGELFGHGDDIRGLTVGIQIQHGVINDFVLGLVKVFPAQNFNNVSHSVLAQKHSTQGALLRQEVVRWGSIPAIGALRGGFWNNSQLRYRHVTLLRFRHTTSTAFSCSLT